MKSLGQLLFVPEEEKSWEEEEGSSLSTRFGELGESGRRRLELHHRHHAASPLSFGPSSAPSHSHVTARYVHVVCGNCQQGAELKLSPMSMDQPEGCTRLSRTPQTRLIHA